jgi:hypothetical protein
VKFREQLEKAAKDNEVMKQKLETHKSVAQVSLPKIIDVEEPEKFQCDQCDDDFVSEALLKGHKKYEHMTCKLCRKPCFSVANLKIHNKSMHPESPRCDECGIAFPNNVGHQVHMKKNHTQVKCTQCDKKFKSKRIMLQHLMRNHARKAEEILEAVFKCKVCEKKFQSLIELKKHTCVDNKDTRAGCHKCIHVAASPKDLNTHMLKSHSVNTAQVKPRSRDEGSAVVRDCRYGQECRFLARNCCKFNHKVAARPVVQGQWQEVSYRRRPNHSQGKVTVQWCRMKLDCNRGRHCPFRHFETIRTDFPLLPMKPTK